jgi:hypothetical protein
MTQLPRIALVHIAVPRSSGLLSFSGEEADGVRFHWISPPPRLLLVFMAVRAFARFPS